MKIYTKKGDKGNTSLLGAAGVSKDCQKVEVLGNLDELNATIGLVLAKLLESGNKKSVKFVKILRREQQNIMNLSSSVAVQNNNLQLKIKKISSEDIQTLEKEIDAWDGDLPKLNNFILPGDSRLSALSHFARSVCRRAERNLVKLSRQITLPNHLIQYLNRLSDWLFVLSRVI